jgi:membrane protein DedA with SNARE-associated domain
MALLTLFGSRIATSVSGYLVIVAAGTVGYLVGAWLGWAIGARVGRPYVEKHQRAF